MKRIKCILLSCLALMTSLTSVNGQTSKNMKQYDFGTWKIHVYTSPEAMGEVSTIIEGAKGLVVLEAPSFKKSMVEFNAYMAELKKPVVQVIANYHACGLIDYDAKDIVMIEGMPAMMKSPMAAGMIKHFDSAFKGAMDTRLKTEPIPTIKQASIQKYAGIDFIFSQGSTTDFPASSISIGGKAYYMHFAPFVGHASPLLIKSPVAISETLRVLKAAEKTNASVYFGSHGAPGTQQTVQSEIAYLEKMQTIYTAQKDANSFINAMKEAFPTYAGAEGLLAVAAALYK